MEEKIPEAPPPITAICFGARAATELCDLNDSSRADIVVIIIALLKKRREVLQFSAGTLVVVGLAMS